MSSASPYIAREAIIVRMANALDDLDRLNHEAARLMAYQRAGIPNCEALAYDNAAHWRQMMRRDLRARGVLTAAAALEINPT